MSIVIQIYASFCKQYKWKRCLKKKMLKTMWTSQVYGHNDKMTRIKTHRTSQNTEYTKTQQTLRNNYFFVFFRFFWGVLFYGQ